MIEAGRTERTEERCDAFCWWVRCELPAGHDGPHRDPNGYQWVGSTRWDHDLDKIVTVKPLEGDDLDTLALALASYDKEAGDE